MSLPNHGHDELNVAEEWMDGGVAEDDGVAYQPTVPFKHMGVFLLGHPVAAPTLDRHYLGVSPISHLCFV